jgi:hypothetical protein
MSRILSVAAAAVVTIACATTAMAQQSSYPDRYSTSNDRYSTSDRSTTYPSRDTTYHDRSATQRPAMWDRRNMARGQFVSEAEARSNCRGDTVVWANTKSRVYHLPGTPKFGNTKHGAFMCQADAGRSGGFRAARNVKAMRGGFSGSSMMPR